MEGEGRDAAAAVAGATAVAADTGAAAKVDVRSDRAGGGKDMPLFLYGTLMNDKVKVNVGGGDGGGGGGGCWCRGSEYCCVVGRVGVGNVGSDVGCGGGGDGGGGGCRVSLVVVVVLGLC